MNLASTVARLRLAVARALVGRINDGTGLQTVQLQIQAGVGRDNVERFQQYGLTSVPFDGAESIALSVGGNTNHQVVISVDDRRYRLRGLKTGEVALFDDQGQAVHLTRAGIVIRGAGLPITVTQTPLIVLDSNVQITKDLQVLGSTQLDGDSATHKGTNIGHDHRHDEVQRGNETSGTPV